MKEKEFSVDLVNNPPHYKGFGFENLDFLEEIFNIMPEKKNCFSHRQCFKIRYS
ncbi:TPA: hypothetical protein ACX8RT_001473 [Campylobacter coli]